MGMLPRHTEQVALSRWSEVPRLLTGTNPSGQRVPLRNPVRGTAEVPTLALPRLGVCTPQPAQHHPSKPGLRPNATHITRRQSLLLREKRQVDFKSKNGDTDTLKEGNVSSAPGSSVHLVNSTISQRDCSGARHVDGGDSCRGSVVLLSGLFTSSGRRAKFLIFCKSSACECRSRISTKMHL
jgi:hypothetical protein